MIKNYSTIKFDSYEKEKNMRRPLVFCFEYPVV